MKQLKFLFLALGAVFLIGGCCENCDKPFLGEFNLTVEEAEWVEFAKEFTREFRSSQGQEMTFFYADFVTGHEDLIEDCEDTRCGFCCSEYRNGFKYTQLRSFDQAYVFDITLRKDFISYTPFDNPEEIGAVLSISLNNTLTCTILDLPNLTLTETVKVGNRDYFEVFTCNVVQNGGRNRIPWESHSLLLHQGRWNRRF
jgi:hypothetical protein